MSSTLYPNQNPTPIATRRSPMSVEDTVNSSQHNENRRSLSNRLRNIFRKSSPSPNRSTTNERNPATTSVRQTSLSPASGNSSTEVPHLRAPAVNWPFGKKKAKSSPTTNTPTTSKKKIKASRKTNQTSISTMVISNPIYQQENPTSIQGQYFTPRAPEVEHSNNGRIQSSSSYEGTTTQGFRDYVIIDHSQQPDQVIVPSGDVFTPSTYTFDHSGSLSMNRPNLPNTNIEHHYYHDNLTSTGSIPIADVEVIPTPQRKRKVGDTPPPTNNKIITEKPPIIPQTSSRSPSAIQSTNSAQWKNTTSSTLNTTGVHSTTSSSMDADAPKLHAPSISFGSSSNKKESKRTKSQTRPDGMSSSSSTISNLLHQNPTKPGPSWTKTYGSLPDAEIYYSDSLTSSKPSKTKANKYPGLSAIVYDHLVPRSVHVKEPSSITKTTTTTAAVSPQRPPRFDTSTTTLNEYEQNQSWSRPINNDSTTSPSSIHRHDGYIRPMTPQEPSVPSEVHTIHIDIEAIPGRLAPPRSSYYDVSTPPTVYRSSATIYTQDKHRYVNGGEIRTWRSHETNINDDYNDLYKKPPYTHVEIDHKHEHNTKDYEHQIVPTKINDNYDEYRYSPRAHEQELYKKEQKIIDEEEIQEEERYEISYEYERQHEQYSYETRAHYDELDTKNRYSNDIDDGDQNLTYSKLSSATRSTIINERDKIYDQSSRSYLDSGRIQERLETVAPVNYSREIPHTCTLRRTDSYDGLGISIAASSDTRSNHCIRDVEPGSPGDRAGLRKNDRILSVNGINVENVDFSDVLILIKQGIDNDNLQLSVIHESEQN